MLSRRSGSKGKVKSRQLEAKRREEEERKKVADKVQGIYAETRKRVEDKLSSLDKEVNASFDRGEKAARQHFENYVDRRMADYKFDRYLKRVGGLLFWAKDKLFGLPEEVNRFYEEGRNRYLREMDVVLTGIANTVESRLKEAKSEIAGGRRKIRDYVESLPKDLQQAGRQAEREVSARFDELAQSVEDKKKDLAQSLAKRYVEARNNLDERIKELKAENGGLVDKFIDKLKDVIQILRNFKARISSLLRKSADVIRQIVKDPIGFLRNLVAAVKQGFNQFARNILKHLQSGLMGFLFGAFAGAGVQNPSGFSVKALFGLVLQVLGVTKEHIRAKLVKKLGARNAERIEQAWSLVSAMIGGGPVGLWGQAKGYLGDFKQMVVSEIRNWVIIQIVKAAILWLISLLNPASALLKAIMAIYNVVMFFIERMNQIRSLVQAIVESVTNIVAGNIGAAANRIEQAMGRSVPVILGFLASLLGLTGITQKIQSIIRKLQRPVDMAIDKVLAKIVGRIKTPSGKAEKGGKPLEVKYPEKTFTVDDESHKLWVKKVGANSTLVISSYTKPFTEFLHDISSTVQRHKLSTKRFESISRAFAIAQQMDLMIHKKEKSITTGKGKRDLERRLSYHEEELAKLVRQIMKDIGLNIFNQNYKLEGMVATYDSSTEQVGDNFTIDHQPSAAVLEVIAKMPEFDGRNIKNVIEGKHVKRGVGINLSEIRHKAGRTYGTPGDLVKKQVEDRVTALNQNIDRANGNARRDAAIKILKREMNADADAMINVVNKPITNNEVWGDIMGLNGLSRVEKRNIISAVRQQILEGEKRIKWQNLDKLKERR
jgi:hypothetical protein